MVTPLVKSKFLQESLASSRFREVSHQHGMFFLHGLDSQRGTLEDILSEDDTETHEWYGQTLVRPISKIQPLARTETVRSTNRHPWGTSISWKKLEELLDTVPEQFLDPWTMDTTWVGNLVISRVLFCTLITQIWAMVGDGFVSEGLLPKPASLKEAINCFTIEAVQATLQKGRCLFKPSYKNPQTLLPISNAPPFSTVYMDLFFPRSTAKKPAWFGSTIGKKFIQKSYFTDYSGFCSQWEEGETELLREDLRWMLDQLQCLPSVDKTGIWHIRDRRLMLLANPVYYQTLNTGAKVRVEPQPRSQVSGAVAALRLAGQLEPRHRKDRRGEKSKRSRKAPPPRVKAPPRQAPTRPRTTQEESGGALQSLGALRSRHGGTSAAYNYRGSAEDEGSGDAGVDRSSEDEPGSDEDSEQGFADAEVDEDSGGDGAESDA